MQQQKKVLITGAFGGLGSALSQVYVDNKWHVIAVDKEVNENAHHQTNIACDFIDQLQVDHLCHALKAHYPIDTLICNAADYHFSAFADISENQLMHSWLINLVSHFKLFQTLVKQSSGIKRLLVIGSDQCFEAMDYNIAYAMSKAGLQQMVKSFAAEYKTPHVMAVAPGTLSNTPITYAAAEGLSKINGLTVQQTLQSFDQESPTGHCIEPTDLAQWIYQLEINNSYPSGHIEFMPNL